MGAGERAQWTWSQGLHAGDQSSIMSTAYNSQAPD